MFAANDDMAIGLIRALTEAGRRVPDDVSVVGFDDVPVAAYVTPPLTTVPQPFDAVAQEGIKRLVHAIENPDAAPLRRATHRSTSSSAPRPHPRRTGRPRVADGPPHPGPAAPRTLRRTRTEAAPRRTDQHDRPAARTAARMTTGRAAARSAPLTTVPSPKTHPAAAQRGSH